MEIHRLDMTPVTSAIINNFYDGKNGEIASRDFAVDLSSIMDGVYKIAFAPYYKNDFGKKTDLDNVEGLSFTKIQGRSSKIIMWQARDWGDIQLPEIILT